MIRRAESAVRRVVARSLAVALLALLGACGGEAAQDPTPGAAPTTGPAPTPAPDPTPVPAPAPASAPPVVSAINVHGSPQAGGGLLLFAGNGLDGTVSVTFGGAAATGLTYDPSNGNLLVTVPPCPDGPTADVFVPIVLVNADGQSTTWPDFHYGNPPVIAGFSPDTGPKGATVTVDGTDFTADATGVRAGLQVSFGGNPATVVSKSATQLTVIVPKMNPGSYPIIVVNFDGQYVVTRTAFLVPGP